MSEVTGVESEKYAGWDEAFVWVCGRFNLGPDAVGYGNGPDAAALMELVQVKRSLLADIERAEKPRKCPSCGEYLISIDVAELVQQETDQYRTRIKELEDAMLMLVNACEDSASCGCSFGCCTCGYEDSLAAAREAMKGGTDGGSR